MFTLFSFTHFVYLVDVCVRAYKESISINDLPCQTGCFWATRHFRTPTQSRAHAFLGCNNININDLPGQPGCVLGPPGIFGPLVDLGHMPFWDAKLRHASRHMAQMLLKKTKKQNHKIGDPFYGNWNNVAHLILCQLDIIWHMQYKSPKTWKNRCNKQYFINLVYVGP